MQTPWSDNHIGQKLTSSAVHFVSLLFYLRYI